MNILNKNDEYLQECFKEYQEISFKDIDYCPSKIKKIENKEEAKKVLADCIESLIKRISLMSKTGGRFTWSHSEGENDIFKFERLRNNRQIGGLNGKLKRYKAIAL